MQHTIQEANRAAHRHDAHRLRNIIRAFAPKAPKKRILLRNANGVIAHPAEELALLRSFVHRIWYDPSEALAVPTIAPGVPFSECDLMHALYSTPIHKSVARPFVPGIIIKGLAAPLAKIGGHRVRHIFLRPGGTGGWSLWINHPKL